MTLLPNSSSTEINPTLFLYGILQMSFSITKSTSHTLNFLTECTFSVIALNVTNPFSKNIFSWHLSHKALYSSTFNILNQNSFISIAATRSMVFHWICKKMPVPLRMMSPRYVILHLSPLLTSTNCCQHPLSTRGI